MATSEATATMPTFDAERATDPDYLLVHADEKTEAAFNGRRVHRTEAIGSNTMYGLVDLVYAYTTCTRRSLALQRWDVIKKRHVGERYWHSHEFRQNGFTDFCTMTDFVEHVLPHLRSPAADAANAAHGRPVLAMQSDELTEAMVAFDAERATDVTYCHDFIQELAEEMNVTIRTAEFDGAIKHSVMDAMQCVGQYVDTDCTRRSWKRIRGDVVSNADFKCHRGGRANKVIYCSLPDFFEFVVPHIDSPVASAIKRTRAEGPGPVGGAGPSAVAAPEDPTATQIETEPFDTARAADLSYCIQFLERRGEAKGVTIRTEAREEQIVYSVVDLMYCIGHYANRDSTKGSWQDLRRSLINKVGSNTSLFKGSNRMDFISLPDFLDHVLPHITGSLASTIKLARSRIATAVMMQPQNTPSVVGPQPAMSDANTEHASPASDTFDSSRASDVGYCIDFFEKLAGARGLSIRTEEHGGQTKYSAVDLIYCVGEYKDRASAKNSWSHHREEVDESFIIFRGANRMDFISLSDFLDHVLPHVTGSLASTIKLARSRVATAVGVGSSLAIALTEANAESSASAPEHIRKIVNEVKSETEGSLVDDGLVPYEGPSRIEGGVTIDDTEVNFVNMPVGPHCYRRVSFGKYIPGFVPPSASKMIAGCHKLGLTDSIVTRHGNNDYRNDGGMMDVLVRTKHYIDAGTLEKMQKAMIHKHRMFYADEYYCFDTFRQEFHLTEDEDPYFHMLHFHSRYIEKVLVAHVTVEKVEAVDGQTTMDKYVCAGKGKGKVAVTKSSPKYKVTVEYKDMDGWEDLCDKPVIVREGQVEVERARQRAAEAETETKRLELEAKQMELEAEKERTLRSAHEARQETARTAQEAERTRQRILELFNSGKITSEQMMILMTGPSGSSRGTDYEPGEPVEPQPPDAKTEDHTESDEEEEEGEPNSGLKEQGDRFRAFYDELCVTEKGSQTSTLVAAAAFRYWLKRRHGRKATKSDIAGMKLYILSRHEEVTGWDSVTNKSERSFDDLALVEMERPTMPDSDFEAFVQDRCTFSYTSRVPTAILIDEYRKWREDKKKAGMEPRALTTVVRESLKATLPKNVGRFVYGKETFANAYAGLQMKDTGLSPRAPSNTSRKQIEKVDVRTGEVVQVFNSMLECNNAIGRKGVSYIPRREIDGHIYRAA
jgi:hypothetical protein